VEGLHTMCLNKFPKGLGIIVHEGGKKYLEDLMRMPYMCPLDTLGFTTEIIETGEHECKLPFKATFLPMQHSPLSQGMRMELDGVTIAYCLDTGYCENVVELARNADLLIIECTLKPGAVSASHLNPENCARIANEACVRKLALTHFEGKSYPDMETRLETEEFVKRLFINTFICRDGMEIALRNPSK